jgi:hypothetical protein
VTVGPLPGEIGDRARPTEDLTTFPNLQPLYWRNNRAKGDS